MEVERSSGRGKEMEADSLGLGSGLKNLYWLSQPEIFVDYPLTRAKTLNLI